MTVCFYSCSKPFQSSDASTSAKSCSEDTDGDSKSPRDDKERRKLVKQRQLQEKANRIVAEAVAKAKASGLTDIPKVGGSIQASNYVGAGSYFPG